MNVVTISELVSNPDQIPRNSGYRYAHRYFEKGVAVVVLPGDVALKPAPEDAHENWYPTTITTDYAESF